MSICAGYIIESQDFYSAIHWKPIYILLIYLQLTHCYTVAPSGAYLIGATNMQHKKLLNLPRSLSCLLKVH